LAIASCPVGTDFDVYTFFIMIKILGYRRFLW
jgi:hypothetical protein